MGFIFFFDILFLLILNLDSHNVTCISCNSHLLTLYCRNAFWRPPKNAIIGFIRSDQNMYLIKWKLPCFVTICCTVTPIQTGSFNRLQVRGTVGCALLLNRKKGLSSYYRVFCTEIVVITPALQNTKLRG